MPRKAKSAVLDLAALASAAEDTGARLVQPKGTAKEYEISPLGALITESFKSGTARRIPVADEDQYRAVLSTLRKDAAALALGLRQKLVNDDEGTGYLEFMGTTKKRGKGEAVPVAE